jgi:hypothetical protein
MNIRSLSDLKKAYPELLEEEKARIRHELYTDYLEEQMKTVRALQAIGLPQKARHDEPPSANPERILQGGVDGLCPEDARLVEEAFGDN